MNLSKENEKIFALQDFLKSCYIGFMIFVLNSFSQRLIENFAVTRKDAGSSSYHGNSNVIGKSIDLIFQSEVRVPIYIYS